MCVVAEATGRRPDFDLSIRRRDRLRIIREWALHRQDGIFDMDRQMYPNLLLNFSIFAAQISVRQNRDCRNLDAELIDFIKRYEKLQHLI